MSSLFRSTGKGGIKRVNTMSRTLTDVHRFKEGVSHALTTYPVELLISPGSEQHENYRTPSIPLKHRALTSNAKEPHPTATEVSSQRYCVSGDVRSGRGRRARRLRRTRQTPSSRRVLG